VSPISEQHAGDLRKLGAAPVAVLANGVSETFVQRFRACVPPRPADLPSDGRPIVGCTGQINSSYDLELMAQIAKSVPEVWFVYIGPIFDEGPDIRRSVDAALSGPNVCWLPAKPHEELPNYLHHFNVCFCPLKVTPANNRRSLLRLFDYVASEKPVISTPVAAAATHGEHVLIGNDVAELTNRIQTCLLPNFTVDVQARRKYVDGQTWTIRGRQFANDIERYCR